MLMSAACDYSYVGQSAAAPAAPVAGHSGSHGADPVVVPVGNTVPDQGAGDADGVGQDGGAQDAGAGGAGAEDAAAGGAGAEDAAAGEEVVEDNGLDVLGTNCDDSDLAPHTGFQESPACVESSHGEVSDQAPSLLIVDAPEAIAVGEDFEMQVATRNLVRDRFLGAAAGGYYLESSFLNEEGLQRGHFHTACRILPSVDEAPDSSGAPEFFVATQDNGGGAGSDTVTIQVNGIDVAGELQCTSWAGDGSHRTPMMTKANQTPAIDSVRITVGGAADADAADADAADAAAAEDAAAGADNGDAAGADNGDAAGADNGDAAGADIGDAAGAGVGAGE
ncbi:MAG: hypothetical protein LH603_15830 [Pseudonocardia sp.]|nr:hypothetical protein [Pseudonocardia sp.]